MFFGRHQRGRLSGLEILVLSIIKNNDGVSGYEIIQKINKKFKDLWKASAGTIYPLLNRLTIKQFVNLEEITEGNRDKKIYRITERGKDALRKVLENNLEPSINTLGDYIRTIFKASVPSDEMLEKMHGCFPFGGFPFNEDINISDFSLKNINRLRRTVAHLETGKQRLGERLNVLNQKIEKYKNALEKLSTERNKNAKQIEIIENDEDFENF